MAPSQIRTLQPTVVSGDGRAARSRRSQFTGVLKDREKNLAREINQLKNSPPFTPLEVSDSEKANQRRITHRRLLNSLPDGRGLPLFPAVIVVSFVKNIRLGALPNGPSYAPLFDSTNSAASSVRPACPLLLRLLPNCCATASVEEGQRETSKVRRRRVSIGSFQRIAVPLRQIGFGRVGLLQKAEQ